MDSLLPPKLVSPERRRLSLFLKVVGIALLAIVLQVPLNMIRGVLSERKAYEAQAEAEIRATWGQQQLLAGPVLVVPYTVTRTWMRETKDADGKAKSVQERSVRSGNAYFLPEKLAVQATIDPEIRYRGIYEVAVYEARLAVSGEFSTVAGDAAVPNAVYDWSRATIGFGLTDARRLRAAPRLTLDGKASAVESSASGDPVLNLTARAPEAGPERTLAFTLDLDLQGSGSLLVVPVGKATTVDFKSAWTNPSFVGAQLPAVRSVGPDGFKATWSLAHYGRGFPQAWCGIL